MIYSNKIPSHDFLKGHDFTNNLKMIFGCKNLQELSKITGIPTSTFSTWNMKNRTSYELMIRIHLALNIPMKDLSLGYQIPHTNNESLKVEEKHSEYVLDTNLSLDIQRKKTDVLQAFDLKNGKLENRHAMLFDSELLVDYDGKKLIMVKHSNQFYIIDTLSCKATNGLYLINIDGLLSLNQIQRIPGQQLAIAFNNSTLNVNESDVSIVGKVVTEINAIIS